MSKPPLRMIPLLALAMTVGVLAGVSTPAAAAIDPDRPVEFDPQDRPLADDVDPDDLWGHSGDLAPSARTDDIVRQRVPLASQYAAQGVEFTGDPLNLAVYPLETRRYTLGTDRFGVYLCSGPGMNAGLTLSGVTNVLNGPVRTYFRQASESRYNPVFTARRTVTVTQNQIDNNAYGRYGACVDRVYASNPTTTDNAAYVVLNNRINGGLAGSGRYCSLPCSSSTSPTRFPANDRWGAIDGGSVGPQGHTNDPHLTTAVHEIGHMIGWPHSYSGGFDQYDNVIDVMSANATANFQNRADDAYATVAWNRYRAGWIDPNRVLVYRGGVRSLKLAPAGRPGMQMVVFPTTNRYTFVTLDARRRLGYDRNLPQSFQGVSAHYIQQLGSCTFGGPSVCWGLDSDIFTYPPAPYSLRHVTRPGNSRRMNFPDGFRLVAHGTKVNVVRGDNTGYTIRLIGFSDTSSSVFIDDIIWLAETGITTGCGATTFCPNRSVTRGQMAAFLARALDLPRVGSQGFTDIAGHTFAADINALAAAGITRGCNPPANDRFCPDTEVTRGQMAAFLTRAFDLPRVSPRGFVDTTGHIFRRDIDSLAAAGITRGCNPPSNNRFCPNSSVVRGQMAAFLHRGERFLP